MNLNISIRYLNSLQEVLCFKHAAQVAIKGEDIEVEIDDFGSEYDMRSSQCVMCQDKPDVEIKEKE